MLFAVCFAPRLICKIQNVYLEICHVTLQAMRIEYSMEHSQKEKEHNLKRERERERETEWGRKRYIEKYPCTLCTLCYPTGELQKKKEQHVKKMNFPTDPIPTLIIYNTKVYGFNFIRVFVDKERRYIRFLSIIIILTIEFLLSLYFVDS